MSITHVATAMIGIKVDMSKLFKEGTPVSKNIDGEMWFDQHKPVYRINSFKDWQVVCVPEREICVIGPYSCVMEDDSRTSGFVIPLEIEKYRRHLEQDLAPLGVWDHNGYGLHAIHTWY